jgi:nucleotide-binding universal stress UspA family protein
MIAVRNILHPTDFSEQSRGAFDMACVLAKACGAKLTVLHVVQPMVSVGEMGAVPMPVPPEMEAAVREQLMQVRPADSGVAVEHLLADGDAVFEILEAAREKKADLIVMGTHGRTGLGRLLMGSVAEMVVRKAPCAVLTVKPAATGEATGV